jgi:hypothetical protein
MKLLVGQFMYPRPCPAKKNPAAHTSMPKSNGSVFISFPLHERHVRGLGAPCFVVGRNLPEPELAVVGLNCISMGPLASSIG